MAYYLVKFENQYCANAELYYTAIAGGERSFMKMLASKQVEGKPLFDQMLYPLTKEQVDICKTYNPVLQNVDRGYRYLTTPLENSNIKRVIQVRCDAERIFKYGRFSFMRLTDLKVSSKYGMLTHTAVISVFGRFYAAFDAVNICHSYSTVLHLES